MQHPDTLDKNSIHVLSSHFYTKLRNQGARNVMSWTRNDDILTKKIVFIPINQGLHWSLVAVVNPGDISSEKHDDESRMPCILFLDSLRVHRKRPIAKNIRKWLNLEWKRKNDEADGHESNPFQQNTMCVFSPRGMYEASSVLPGLN